MSHSTHSFELFYLHMINKNTNGWANTTGWVGGWGGGGVVLESTGLAPCQGLHKKKDLVFLVNRGTEIDLTVGDNTRITFGGGMR